MAEDGVNARLVTLTDGVLSIAMTLLVLDVRLPGDVADLSNAALWQALLGIETQLEGYGLSFLVIAVFWLSHVQKFRHIQRSSATLTWLHIFFLLMVGLVPFTTSVLAENGNAVSTALYAVVMALASGALGLMSIHARLAGLADDSITNGRLRTIALAQFGTTLVFLASAGIAFADSGKAKYVWLLLIPLGFVRDRRRRTAD